jgi:hypothetical protein
MKTSVTILLCKTGDMQSAKAAFIENDDSQPISIKLLFAGITHIQQEWNQLLD